MSLRGSVGLTIGQIVPFVASDKLFGRYDEEECGDASPAFKFQKIVYFCFGSLGMILTGTWAEYCEIDTEDALRTELGGNVMAHFGCCLPFCKSACYPTLGHTVADHGLSSPMAEMHARNRQMSEDDSGFALSDSKLISAHVSVSERGLGDESNHNDGCQALVLLGKCIVGSASYYLQWSALESFLYFFGPGSPSKTGCGDKSPTFCAFGTLFGFGLMFWCRTLSCGTDGLLGDSSVCLKFFPSHC